MKTYIVVLTQRELDALWLISGYIGGSSTESYRCVFNNIWYDLDKRKSDHVNDIGINGSIIFNSEMIYYE